MKWFQFHFPIVTAGLTALIWVYSTFAQTIWVKEYVDSRHKEVMESLSRIENSNQRQWDKIWELNQRLPKKN